MTWRGRGVVILATLLLVSCGPKAVDENKSHHRTDLAKDLIRSRQLEGAEQEAREALRFNPGNEEAYYLLGLIDYLRGVNNFLLLEQLDCVTGVDAEVLRIEIDKQFELAEQNFARAAEIAPDYGEAWASRGLVAIQTENYDRAIEYFNKAFEGRRRLQHLSLTRAHLGWARFHRGETAEAAKELRQALQFHPGMCVAKYRLGRVYFARKEWQKALAEFQAVVNDTTCGMQEAHLYRLKTLVAMGQAQGISEAQNQCVALAPKSCMARECAVLSPNTPARQRVAQPKSKRRIHDL